MLDLLDFCSLDIQFDPESNALLYGENVKCNSCQKITLKNLSPILLNKALIYPEQVYEEYKGIYYQQDENLVNGCISYDLINLPSGLLGIEYIKTHVYFTPIDNCDDKVSCIIEILFGNLYLVLQKNAPRDEQDFFTRVEAGYLVRLKQGDRFVVPEGYLYTFINASENNAIFSRVYKQCSLMDYTSLKKERGLAYYCIRKNGRQEIVHNPFYKDTPGIVELTIDTPLFNSDIGIEKPLYESLKSRMDFLLAKLAG